jgi:thioester reductase-like protein
VEGSLLITGATGFLGGQIMARYLERTDRHVFALVRAPDDGEAERRVRTALAATYGAPDAHEGRVTAVRGDLERPNAGLEARRLDEMAEQVTDVVHAAASIEFSLPLDEARRINVDGTERVLELAERCERRGGLHGFAHVSTTYIAGAYDACFGEDDLDVGQPFRNTYERTKFEAEGLVRRWASRLPVRVFRPGIVVGESESGWTPVFNVLYYPIRLFAKGQNAHVVPARHDTPIDAVPVDYVADAIFELAGRDGESGETFHLVAGRDAGSFGELLDMSARHFGRRPPVLIPLRPYMIFLHPLLKRAARGSRKRMFDQVGDFLPYFSMRQTFGDSRARAALEPAGLEAPALTSYFDRLLDYTAASNWGKQPLARDEARARAATTSEAQSVHQS